MENKLFKVGDRVGINLSLKFRDEWDDNPQLVTFYHDENEPATYGKILSLKKTKAVIELDDCTEIVNYLELSTKDDDSVIVDVKHLLSESEMKEKESQLEKDFLVISTKIKKTVKKAASMIGEAQKMAEEQGRNLADMHDAYESLYDAMDSAGWRTSSFGC